MAQLALVVEDDPDIRTLVAFKLRGAGFEVVEESDGEAAHAIALELKPDVILLDWMIPGLSGLGGCPVDC